MNLSRLFLFTYLVVFRKRKIVNIKAATHNRKATKKGSRIPTINISGRLARYVVTRSP